MINRRSFLGAALAIGAALCVPFRRGESSEEPAATMGRPCLDQPPVAHFDGGPTPYKVERAGGPSVPVEFVRLPWSDPRDPSGQSIQARILYPLHMPFSDHGYFVKTDGGLREVADDWGAKAVLLDHCLFEQPHLSLQAQLDSYRNQCRLWGFEQTNPALVARDFGLRGVALAV